MANIKSSKKDIRKSLKRREANSQKKNTIRTFAKKIMKSIESGNKEEASTLYNTFASLVDKAAKVNIYHKNKASRDKARMAKRIHQIKAK